MRTRTTLAILVVLVSGVSPARADDTEAARRERLVRAGQLVETGLTALREGRHDAAVEALTKARAAAPQEAVVAYDQAVALAAAGKLDEARKAYGEAVRTADPDDAAGPAARHNLGTLALGAARDALRLLEDPDALADAIREQGSPDGQPLSGAMVETLAQKRRSELVGQGMEAARGAVELLRAALRANPSAADSARNLVLAQRARRALEEEARKQQEEPQKGGEDGDENAPPENQEGDSGKPEASPPDESAGDQDQPPSGSGEQESESKPETGDQGDSKPESGEPTPETPGEPRDLDREEAERSLERLLETAARKARQVEQMRAERLRRGAVERDW